MISDAMYQKWLFFTNHFLSLSIQYREMSFVVSSDTICLPGFEAFLRWEAKERWEFHDCFCKWLKMGNRKVVLDAVPKPLDSFDSEQTLFTHAVDLENTTISALSIAITEAAMVKCYYSEMYYKEMYLLCVEQMQEVLGVSKKLTMYASDPAALQELDESLYNKYYNKQKEY